MMLLLTKQSFRVPLLFVIFTIMFQEKTFSNKRVEKMFAHLEQGIHWVPGPLKSIFQITESFLIALLYRVDFSERVLDQLLNEHRYGKVMDILTKDFLEQGYLNNNPADYLSNRLKSWIFARAEQGHFWLLLWAAKLCLQVGPLDERRGHLYLLKANARLAQDINVFPELQERETLYYELCAKINALAQPFDGWSDKDALFTEVKWWLDGLDLEGEWSAQNFVSPVWLLYLTHQKILYGIPVMTPKFRAWIAQVRKGVDVVKNQRCA